MNISKNELQDIISSASHPGIPPIDGLKYASVALLISEDSRDKILGILKASHNKYPWGNQVALPGGHVDDADKSPMETASREVREELGLKNIDLIGSIGHFMTIKNVCVEVFAGFYDENEKITPLESEIAKVLKLPIEGLLETHFKKDFSGREPSLEELLYPHEDVVIWGLTARIIHHFLEISRETICKDSEIQEIC